MIFLTYKNPMKSIPPPPKVTTNLLCHYRLVLPALKLHINWLVQYLLFQLFLLNMFLRYIHVIMCISISSLLILNNILRTYKSCFKSVHQSFTSEIISSSVFSVFSEICWLNHGLLDWSSKYFILNVVCIFDFFPPTLKEIP